MPEDMKLGYKIIGVLSFALILILVTTLTDQTLCNWMAETLEQTFVIIAWVMGILVLLAGLILTCYVIWYGPTKFIRNAMTLYQAH